MAVAAVYGLILTGFFIVIALLDWFVTHTWFGYNIMKRIMNRIYR
jgi:hypothetical protein